MPTETCKGFTKSNKPCKKPAGAFGYCHLHSPTKSNAAEQQQETKQPTDSALLADRLKVYIGCTLKK